MFKLVVILCRLIKFEKEKYARIGVMPRHGDSDSLRWFGVEPCAALHIINCYEEGDEVSNFRSKLTRKSAATRSTLTTEVIINFI